MIRFLLTAILAAPLLSQSFEVVPQDRANLEGESRIAVPGMGSAGANQYLLGAGQLQSLVGRTITSLALRRDANWSESVSAGSSTVVVRMGHASVTPLGALADFSLNVASPTEVFRATVALPAAGPAPSPPSWSAPFAIELPFSTPFTYVGGTLGIEIEGSNVAPAEFWWAVDGVEDDLAGSVAYEGLGCGPRGFPNGFSGLVAETSLVLGSSADFVLYGQPNASAFLLLGASTFPNPIDLGALGAPGCELRVDFFAVLAKTVVDSGIQGVGGLARALVPLPAQTTLLGGQLYAQWLELGAVIASSQTMRFQIAPRLPVLDMTTLIRHADGSVEIRPRKAPVFGFRYL
jgi:hypothetical protein